MCKLRQVCLVYAKCAHVYPQPDEIIQCSSETCVFSPNHPATCRPPKCRRSCWQRHQYPEQYSRTIDAVCPTCVANN